jgi:hypothetical protein
VRNEGTEPKQIGEGNPDRTERRDSLERQGYFQVAALILGDEGEQSKQQEDEAAEEVDEEERA